MSLGIRFQALEAVSTLGCLPDTHFCPLELLAALVGSPLAHGHRQPSVPGKTRLKAACFRIILSWSSAHHRLGKHNGQYWLQRFNGCKRWSSTMARVLFRGSAAPYSDSVTFGEGAGGLSDTLTLSAWLLIWWPHWTRPFRESTGLWAALRDII